MVPVLWGRRSMLRVKMERYVGDSYRTFWGRRSLTLILKARYVMVIVCGQMVSTAIMILFRS